MTMATRGMSRPRAATPVATRTGVRPAVKFLSASSLSLCRRSLLICCLLNTHLFVGSLTPKQHASVSQRTSAQTMISHRDRSCRHRQRPGTHPCMCWGGKAGLTDRQTDLAPTYVCWWRGRPDRQTDRQTRDTHLCMLVEGKPDRQTDRLTD